MIRRPSSPLEQVVRRLSEHHPEIPCLLKKNSLRKPHFDGPIPRNFVVTIQYKERQTGNYVVIISSGNNCIQVGSNIAIVHNFCTVGEIITEKSMITLLIEVKAEMKEIKPHVKHLLNIQQSTTTEDEEEDIAFEELSLPCTDVDELFQLNEKLKINKTVHKELLSILSTTGGRNLREVIYRMMRELMLNCVLRHFNWTGQGSKHSFRDLALGHVMERHV
ncbi:hypothetical protein HOLleu_25141 [Holothuria leucospilota]|uniref:DUF4806 domain-containing protein n=1 Tax=Holothuria leucospilota TaxID=206669 RepID=A0A9Q1BS27_HOLLE|nr:hypothetical protein HOLleu_25141 [Holothuria leucospilota]